MKHGFLPLCTLTAGLACAPLALAHGGHGADSVGNQPTTTTATVPTSAVSIDISRACRGGGIRAMTGSYDPASGTLTQSTTNVYALDLVSVYATTATNGTGSVTKTNCSLDLTETQRGDIVQHLLRDATQLDH
jgi:hypothetical protein